MENLSTLTGKYGVEGDKLLFKILNSGEFLGDLRKKNMLDANLMEGDFLKNATEKGLRYDLTVPLARFVVMNRHKISFPFRRYQIQPVWRADRPQKGRYREFYQCDADVLGSDSLLNEAELVMIYAEAFHAFDLDIRIKINNRKVLEGLVEVNKLDIPFNKVAIAIDKLDKIGEDGVSQELVKEGLQEDKAKAFLRQLSMGNTLEEKLHFLETTLLSHEKGNKGVHELKEIFRYLRYANFNFENLELDLTLARGLDYYTGAIFEVITTEVKIGSLGGGGRYDDLTGIFGLKGISGVGISFGADRIYDALEEAGKFPQDTGQSITAMICCMLPEAFQLAVPAAKALRVNGISCMVYPEAVKMQKQLELANKLKVKYAIIIGQDEIASEKPALKNLETGLQEHKTVAEIINILNNLK